MIGDRSDDILAANALAMESIGVLWGYGDRAELEAAAAGAIVEQPSELSRVLSRSRRGARPEAPA